MTAPAIRPVSYGFTPPGYYVAPDERGYGPCAHCEAPLVDHQGRERFCPKPPRELAS